MYGPGAAGRVAATGTTRAMASMRAASTAALCRRTGEVIAVWISMRGTDATDPVVDAVRDTVAGETRRRSAIRGPASGSGRQPTPPPSCGRRRQCQPNVMQW